MDFKDRINTEKLPKHVAVIMDGNGRWAKTHGKPRIFGHKNGVRAVRETVEAAAEIGVAFLTLYAFSTENWNRPKFEVDALMSLLVDTINKEIETLMKNNIRLMSIGDSKKLPSRTNKALQKGIAKTANNTRMTLTLALNYSARWDIQNAVKQISQDTLDGKVKPEDVNEDVITSHLSTHYMPDPELLIRTSGEHRISNFLLWEISYAEFYFTEEFWPEFTKEDFYKAIYSFQTRERRFGQTSDQVHSEIKV